jgi:hypothetical protein
MNEKEINEDFDREYERYSREHKEGFVKLKMPTYFIAKHSDEDLKAAVLKEREACAKLCDDWLVGRDDICEVAKAIRGRDMYTKPKNIDTSKECVHETDKSIHDDDDIQEYKRPWVGLTDEEIKGILDCGRGGLVDIKKAEQILKERNA